MNKKIIFLDFDGVLFDSVKEAYLLARYAYYDIPVKNKIDEKHYQKFRKYRYLITNSWQYYLLVKICGNNDENSIESVFKQYLLDCTTEEYKEFNKKFLDQRQNLINNDFKFWNTLETPTLFLLQIKPELSQKNYAILSTKNKLAIMKKFENLNIQFNQNLIFDKNDLINISKGEFISNYLKQNNIKKAIFIDDSIENIQSCTHKNIIPLLTNWGYTAPGQLGLNEDEILNILLEGDK